MRTVAAFVRLSRPKFLLGGFAGFALGVAVAAYRGVPISLAAYLGGQATVTAFHLMTHYANDYFDRHADVHTRPTAFAGGSGVLVTGALAPRVALAAAQTCAALGTLGAAAFALAGNPLVTALSLTIGVLAWSYSAPPLRLSARGWGEVDTAIIVAVLVPLTGYAAMAGTVDQLAFAATFAPACAMLAMMIAVEWPDREADAAAGKHNLLVRFGAPAAGTLAAACALLVVPAALAALYSGAPASSVLFAVLLVPLTAGFARRVARPGNAGLDIAAHGVTLYFVTVVFEVFGYVTVLR